MASYILYRWPLTLFTVGVSQYLLTGIVSMLAIVTNRDQRWSRGLRRIQWASFGIAGLCFVILVIGESGSR